jgi:hypothetical protein
MVDLRTYSPFNVEDTNSFQNFDRLKELWEDVQNIPLLNGRLIESLSLSATVTNVEHELDRDYKGWIITDLDANQTIYRDTSSTLNANKFLPLLASGAVTASIWVF